MVNPDQTIAGIVTERDMMIRVLAKGINVDTTALADIMSTEIHAANENDELIDWLKLLMADDIPDEVLKNRDQTKAIPPLYGALVKNEQDVQLLERLAFMHRRESSQ